MASGRRFIDCPNPLNDWSDQDLRIVRLGLISKHRRLLAQKSQVAGLIDTFNREMARRYYTAKGEWRGK